MHVYGLNNVDLTSIKLYSVDQTRDATNMIHIRNKAHGDDNYGGDDGFYVRGPKCHFSKESNLSSTERFKTGLVFNSDDVVFVDFLENLRSHLIRELVKNKERFFEPEDIEGDGDGDISALLNEIFAHSHTINASKGNLKLIVHCNSRNNTKWAKEYQLEAETADGKALPLSDVSPSALFYPILRIRGIRTKGNFQVEFMLRKMIVLDSAAPLNAAAHSDINVIKENNAMRNQARSAEANPRTDAYAKSNASESAYGNNERRGGGGGGGGGGEELDEVELTMPADEDSATDASAPTFKVRKPKNVYQGWVKQFKLSLRAKKRDYMRDWLSSNNIHQARVILDHDDFSDDDDELDGYAST